MSLARSLRKVHAWISVVIALPLLVVIGSGVLLQLKKHAAWIQPPEQRGATGDPAIAFDRILEACRSVPEARVATWDDVHRIDVRPSRGMLKVWAKSDIEVQVCAVSGAVLQVAARRSDLIESIHDGSWFHELAKPGLFLPAGILLFLLWLSGLYLFFQPRLARRRRRL